MVYVRHKHDGVNAKPLVDRWRVKHKDLFHAKYFYMLLHEWLLDEGLCGGDDSFPEVFYLTQDVQGASHVWFWWRLVKPENTFLKFELDIDCHIIALTDAEFVKDNKKFKANKGDCEVTVSARLVYDSGDKFKKHPIISHFYDVWFKRIYLSDYYAKRKEYLETVQRLMEAMKVYFKLKTYLAEPEGQNFWMNEDFE